MLSSAEALVRVVDDVIEVSRLEMGAVEIDSQPFDIMQLVRD